MAEFSRRDEARAVLIQGNPYGLEHRLGHVRGRQLQLAPHDRAQLLEADCARVVLVHVLEEGVPEIVGDRGRPWEVMEGQWKAVLEEGVPELAIDASNGKQWQSLATTGNPRPSTAMLEEGVDA